MPGLITMRLQRQRRDARERLGGSTTSRPGRSMPTTPARRPSCRRPDHPRAARWLNRDPISEKGGYHLLRFCLNSPLNRVDPLGLDVCSDRLDACLATAQQNFDINSTLATYYRDQAIAHIDAAERLFVQTVCSRYPPGTLRYSACVDAADYAADRLSDQVKAAYYAWMAGIIADYVAAVGVCYVDYGYCQLNKCGIW